ncbi:MAG: DEAD/DEAH box helicase family protein, partial [Candidatus Thorarchaeota archaeon]
MSKAIEDDPVLKSEKIEFRKYQVEIAEKCVNKNSLVVLPTGLGKTIIAVLTASKTLKFFPKGSKVIILAPTRPLINQHYDTFSKFLPISHEKFTVLTGKVLPEKRVLFYEENQILFYTPQTLRNDLVNRRYTLEQTALIIFDEAHHASGDYAYTMIADEFAEQNPDGVTLALTASPGASKKKISILCENLHIPLANIHIRTRKDSDVKTYLKPMSIFKIGVNLTELMEESYSAVIVVLEERLHYLSQLSFLDVKSEVLHTKVFRKDLLKLNRELVALLQRNEDKTGLYSALSINAQALILYHMLELIEQQGLDVLLYYLEKLYTDAKKKTSSKAVKILASDSRIRRVFIELKKNQDFTPEKLIHPKYHILQKVLLDELSQNPDSRILVFVKLRDSLKNIVKQLRSVEKVKPVRFVGQATKSNGDKGMSQKLQIETLDQFKKGIYNVLVSTNVGEEGL